MMPAVEVRVPGQHLLGGRVDAGRIAAVDLHGVDAGVPGGDLVKQVGSPAADDHGVAPGVQLHRQGEADAAGGAGDEDGVA
jgi:hypothetical protein